MSQNFLPLFRNFFPRLHRSSDHTILSFRSPYHIQVLLRGVGKGTSFKPTLIVQVIFPSLTISCVVKL